MTDIEAIEWLKQISDKYIHGGDEWFDEQRCRAIEYAIECIYKHNKWIPVSERLPEDDRQVLACTKKGKAFSAHYDHLWKSWSVSHTVKITHWMPLPEPPKEVSNEA
jgi:hypothetical protein